MKIGLGIGIPFIRNYVSSIVFDPSKLFTGSTNGAWYDPSDINLAWRRSLLTYTEQFDNAAWVASAVNITANALSAPDGTLTADMFTTTSVFNSFRLNSDVTVTPSTSYTLSFYAYRGSATDAKYSIYNTSAGADIVSATSFFSQTVSGAWSRVTLTFTAPAGCTSIRVFLLRDTGVLGSIYIWGAQLEVGPTATPYQRITDGIKDYLDYKPLPILYQDAAGTTPVTAVGQPVGLMLDKSKGLVLGPELVTNGDFTSATGWTAAASWGIASGVATKTAGTDGWVEQPSKLTVGAWYQFTLVLTAHSGGNLSIGSRAGLGFVAVTASGARTVTGYFNATATGFGIYGTSTTSATVDNISVRELPGNHAFNPSGNSANFPVLSARYNLLTKTEQFDDAVWAKSLATITANAVAAPDGTLTADKLVEDTSAGLHRARFTYVTTAVSGFTLSFYLKAGERSFALVELYATGTASVVGGAYFNLTTGTAGTLTGDSASIASAGNGWFRCTVSGATVSSVTSLLCDVYLAVGDNNRSYTGDGTSGIYLWGADLRPTNDALNQPAYQRVNTTTDYDTVGFKPYLSFNGVNQWLQTNSIDFTYGDKMFVAAGVRKLSDGTASIMETSSDAGANLGSMFLYVNNDTITSKYRWLSRGTNIAAASGADNNPAPRTDVISGIGNISGDQAVLRINGTQASINTADQGTGNYGNYPLYIGARTGTSLWFNGRLYGLVVAGKQASAGEIANVERHLNIRTGAY